jgi:enolase-phosphatase E1
VRALLFDIEGTITSLAFVTDELFPHARRTLAEYLYANADRPQVQAILYRLARELRTPMSDLEGISATLGRWIDEDRKHPELKELQGLVWEDGYRSGAFRGHLYPDVVPFWERARAAGLALAIYSSGSVRAQRLLLECSVAGDVSPLIDHYFDTRVGAKGDIASYQHISTELAIPAGDICFYSDAVPELDAARAAGCATCRVLRPGVSPAQHDHHEIADFTEAAAILDPR